MTASPVFNVMLGPKFKERETYLASLFFVGLKAEIQDRIYQLEELPTTYEGMMKKAIDIDN
jgi:hypothetical protein